MKLVEDIIDLLSRPDTDLENALVMAQVLAHKLGEEELAVWVKNELVGYQDLSMLPKYRIVPVTPYGDISNGYQRYTNFRLPSASLPDKLRDQLLIRQIGHSVAVIRDWSKSKGIQAQLPPESYGLFSKSLDRSYHVERAWGIFSEGAFTQMLVEVRSRFLGFMLKLSDKFPAEPPQDNIKRLSKEFDVNGIFKGAVFGDGAVLNLAIGTNNTAVQNNEQSIVKSDFDALSAELKKYEVADADIQDLQIAVNDDDGAEEHSAGNYGPKVRSWFGGMISKAGTAAWSLSTQTAAGVLANALSKYYGFN